MNTKAVKSLMNWCLILLLLPNISTVFAKSNGGSMDGGGGDQYTLDFIKNAQQIIYPWLKKNSHKLSIKVDAEDFLAEINPREILSQSHVFESCDGSLIGREVEGCFNPSTNLIYLSRTRYIPNDVSPSKLGFIAHEIFRKMGLEGDDYEITKQISIARVSSQEKSISYPAVVIEKINDEVVIFQQCLTESSCTTIGRPYGYEIRELQFNPKLNKVKALGVGAVEGVAAAGAVMITILTAGLGPLGAHVTIMGLGLSGVAISSATIDAMNPVLIYKMANIEEKIQGTFFENNDFLAIELKNRDELLNYTATLKMVLKRADR